MREQLRAIKGTRARFRATVGREGHRTSGGYRKEMLLLVNVMDERGLTQLTDHVWLNLTPALRRQGLQEGQRIEFTARVRPYEKGYHDDRRLDYRLSHPTQFRVLGQPTEYDDRGNGLLWPDAFDERELTDGS